MSVMAEFRHRPTPITLLRPWPDNGAVIRYRLGAGDASVRWAMSPIHEVVSLAQLFTKPHRHPLFHS